MSNKKDTFWEDYKESQRFMPNVEKIFQETLYPNCKLEEIKTAIKDQETAKNLDKEGSIDCILTTKYQTKRSIQIKTVSYNVWMKDHERKIQLCETFGNNSYLNKDYPNFSIETANVDGVASEGEYFKGMYNYLFIGFKNKENTGFEKFLIINAPLMKDIIESVIGGIRSVGYRIEDGDGKSRYKLDPEFILGSIMWSHLGKQLDFKNKYLEGYMKKNGHASIYDPPLPEVNPF